jgi:cephalosporin hydroxylase
MTLEEIYQSGVARWGSTPTSFTDKGVDHDYIRFYQEQIIPQDQRLLEIGTSSGGSAWLWQQWLKTSTITSVDIADTWAQTRPFQEFCRSVEFIWNFDSRNPQSYQQFKQQFTIIIDDGDHSAESQIATIKAAWPYLAPGGLYVIEDLTNMVNLHHVARELYLTWPEQSWQTYQGKRYPSRQDDLMIYVRKN